MATIVALKAGTAEGYFFTDSVVDAVDATRATSSSTS